MTRPPETLYGVIRQAYATAGQHQDGRDVFQVIADAVETAYGPMVHRVVSTRDDDPDVVLVYAEARVGDNIECAATRESARLLAQRQPELGLDRVLVNVEMDLRRRFDAEMLPRVFEHNGEPVDEIPELVEIDGLPAWRPARKAPPA